MLMTIQTSPVFTKLIFAQSAKASRTERVHIAEMRFKKPQPKTKRHLHHLQPCPRRITSSARQRLIELANSRFNRVAKIVLRIDPAPTKGTTLRRRDNPVRCNEFVLGM